MHLPLLSMDDHQFSLLFICPSRYGGRQTTIAGVAAIAYRPRGRHLARTPSHVFCQWQYYPSIHGRLTDYSQRHSRLSSQAGGAASAALSIQESKERRKENRFLSSARLNAPALDDPCFLFGPLQCV